MGDFMCPHGRTSWGMCPHCIGVNSNSSLTPVPLPSPAPNREPTAERCTGLGAQWCPACGTCTCPHRDRDEYSDACPLHGENSNHAAEPEVDEVADLRAQISREVEARRRAEAERDARRESLAQEIREGLRVRGLWTPSVAADLITAVFKAIDDARAALATEKEARRRAEDEWFQALVSARQERDEARAALAAAHRERDQWYSDSAVARAERAEAALATAQGDLDSLTRELATICGGPGQPREGETRVAYWLRRVGETLAMTERERDEAKDQQRQLSDFAKDVARQRDEARAALATERETHNQTAADAQKLALALAEARDALATAERERDEERVSLRSLRTELWEGVRAHGLKVPSQGSESVRLIAAYCGGIVAAREKADRAESALATATGAMKRAISALERIESRTDEPLTAGFAKAEANALRTALAAPPPSPPKGERGGYTLGAAPPPSLSAHTAGSLIRESGCLANARLAGESLDRYGQPTATAGEGVTPPLAPPSPSATREGEATLRPEAATGKDGGE